MNTDGQQSDNATNDASNGVAPSHHKLKTLKGLSPQLVASVISGLFHLVAGLSLGYLAVIYRFTVPSAPFELNFDQIVWIAYAHRLSVSAGGLLCGLLMDNLGRLNTIKLAVVPTLVGWITLTAAKSVEALFTGMAFLGIGVAWGTCAGSVYVTEIAHPNIRGSLLSIGPAYKLLGTIALSFSVDHIGWRVLAGIGMIFAIAASAAVALIPESPVWLISKGRDVQAKKSLDWFDKHQPVVRDDVTFAQHHFELLAKEETPSPGSGSRAKTKHLLGLFYKPFLILLGLLIFQQLSAFNVMRNYLAADFQRFNRDIGWDSFTMINLGLQIASVVANLVLLLVFRRRSLIIVGSVAMALCLLVHAFCVSTERDPSSRWITFEAISLYSYFAFAYVSVGSVPLTMVAELFPLKIRGVASSIVYSLPNVLMIAFGYLYPHLGPLRRPGFFEWTFLVIVLLGAVYTFIFLPETHKLDLASIQRCFKSNKVYIKWFWERDRNRRGQNEEIAMTHV